MAIIAGLNQVIARLNQEINGVSNGTIEGLLAAGLFIKGEAIEITPLRFGPLRNSAYVAQDVTSRGPVVQVGYTQSYAPYVHEWPDTVNWTTIGTGNKFLEKAVPKPQKGVN